MERGRRALAFLSSRFAPNELKSPWLPPSVLPIPSVRLKAYRRGQQDVEYLTLWTLLHNQPRLGDRPTGARGPESGRKTPGDRIHRRRRRRTIDYGRLRPRDVWALRVAIGEELSKAHPAPKSKLVEFRTPQRS